LKWPCLAGYEVAADSYVADHCYFLGVNAGLIHFSSLLLVIGFGLCAIGIQKRPNQTLQRNAGTAPSADEALQPRG
jgi:hypothetical protein